MSSENQHSSCKPILVDGVQLYVSQNSPLVSCYSASNNTLNCNSNLFVDCSYNNIGPLDLSCSTCTVRSGNYSSSYPNIRPHKEQLFTDKTECEFKINEKCYEQGKV